MVVWPVSSSQRMMRSFGMSLHNTQRISPNHTGPSLQVISVASRSPRCGSFLVALHLRLWCCGSNQLAGACQRLSLGAAARQQAVVADAVKALRQDMQDEAPGELRGRPR